MFLGDGSSRLLKPRKTGPSPPISSVSFKKAVARFQAALILTSTAAQNSSNLPLMILLWPFEIPYAVDDDVGGSGGAEK